MLKPSTPPKDPLVVLLLNLFLCWCVGYFYLGAVNKGLAAVGAGVLGAAVCFATCGIGAPIMVAGQIAFAVDGYKTAVALKNGKTLDDWAWFPEP